MEKAIAVDETSPYIVCIQVLAFRYATGRQVALTGEMIAAYAEAIHILGRTKDSLPREIWAGLNSEVARCVNLFERAWNDSNPHLVGVAGAPPYPGRGLAEAFEAAVAGLQIALHRLREEFRLLGKASWLFDELPPAP